MAAVKVQFPLLVVWYWGMGITLEIEWLQWLWKIICQTIYTPPCDHSFTVITCILLLSGVFQSNQKPYIPLHVTTLLLLLLVSFCLVVFFSPLKKFVTIFIILPKCVDWET
jgi:hypothetical protein